MIITPAAESAARDPGLTDDEMATLVEGLTTDDYQSVDTLLLVAEVYRGTQVHDLVTAGSVVDGRVHALLAGSQTAPPWLANGELAMAGALYDGSWSSIITVLVWLASRVESYIEGHEINGVDRGTHHAVLRRFVRACRLVCDWRKLDTTKAERVAPIRAAYVRATGLLG